MKKIELTQNLIKRLGTFLAGSGNMELLSAVI